MKIVKIHGGLGNQMFQYAFALRLAAEGRDEVCIDTGGFDDQPAHNGFELGRLFSVSLPEAPREVVKRLAIRPMGILNRVRRKYLTKRSHIIDRKFGYQPELLSLEGDAYFEGYWQSEKYFAPIAAEIRSAFTFRQALAKRNEGILAAADRPLVSVHVRRGDYVTHDNLNLCSPRYYENAARALAEAGIEPPRYLVFSDDAEYCRRELGSSMAGALVVDWNRGSESWQDMAMMAACDLHIIANSSFSWWGAWLDEKPGRRVIAPGIWNRRELYDRDHYYSYTFGDIVPESWERAAP